MADILKFTDSLIIHESMEEYEYHEYEPITGIHRGIKFEEIAWLEEYINLNTKLRIEAKKSGNNF